MRLYSRARQAYAAGLSPTSRFEPCVLQIAQVSTLQASYGDDDDADEPQLTLTHRDGIDGDFSILDLILA